MPMFWTNHKFSDSTIISSIVGVFLLVMYTYALVDDRKHSKDIFNNHTEYTNIGNIGDSHTFTETNTKIPELKNTKSKPTYHYTLDVVTRAQDEYWEIERIDNNYYRVRRQDHEDSSIHYEFDLEEYIGDVNDLYNYAMRNNIKGTQIYGY